MQILGGKRSENIHFGWCYSSINLNEHLGSVHPPIRRQCMCIVNVFLGDSHPDSILRIIHQAPAAYIRRCSKVPGHCLLLPPAPAVRSSQTNLRNQLWSRSPQRPWGPCSCQWLCWYSGSSRPVLQESPWYSDGVSSSIESMGHGHLATVVVPCRRLQNVALNWIVLYFIACPSIALHCNVLHCVVPYWFVLLFTLIRTDLLSRIVMVYSLHFHL